jgi:hypothetical protein
MLDNAALRKLSVENLYRLLDESSAVNRIAKAHAAIINLRSSANPPALSTINDA